MFSESVNGTYDENPIYIFWTKEQNLYNRYNRVFVQRVNNFQSHAKLTLEPARSSGAAERHSSAGALSRSRGQAARNAGAGQSGDQNTQKGLAGRPGALASSQFGGSAYNRVTTFRGATAIMSAETPDPLLELLQRYEAERAAFDEFSYEQIPDWGWDRIALETWSRTQDEILERQPPVTTAAGAILALDHVLRSEDLWEPEQSADQQMLWHLIKSARDFIIDN